MFKLKKKICLLITDVYFIDSNMLHTFRVNNVQEQANKF